MAEHCTSSFIYLLCLLVAGTVVQSDSSRMSRGTYIEIGLDNEAICSPIFNPSTDKLQVLDDLRKNKDSAIMIKPSHIFDTWIAVKYNKYCKFKIKATKGEGLSAVIQKMSLRRRGSECIDYIQFLPETGGPSERYCGRLDNYNGLKRYTAITGPTEYDMQNADYQNDEKFPKGKFEEFNSQGKITTEIFISRQPLLPGESLDLVIIYTPYKDCRNIEDRTDYWSGPPHYGICINSKFVCDGYTNCDSLICDEESNCTNIVNRIISDGMGTKVTISAVTTIFLCFIIFVLCLWICRKHKKLCWSPDCAGPSTTISDSTSGLPMERGEQNASNPPYVATAPMLEVVVPASLHDKDLPPSYDSLFPSQANTVVST